MSDTTTKTEEQYVMQASVQGLLNTIKQSDGGPTLNRELNVIGADAIKKARNLQSVMQTAVSDALPQLESDSELAKIIDETVEATDEINPSSVTKSFLYKIPIKSVRRFLVKGYIKNFESTSSKVNGLFDALEMGKEQLLEKMLELEAQYRHLRETDADLTRDISMAEQVRSELESMDKTAMDEYAVEKYDSAMAKVARKIRDMETIKVAISQFFVSIKQTAEVQILLSESIDSLRTVGPIVFQNAILINAAISQQRKVAEAARKVSDSLSNAMADNARIVKGNAAEIADLYNNPVLAMDKLESSFNDLADAVKITQEARLKATETANEMTKGLRAMNDKFAPITHGAEDSLEDAIGKSTNVVSEQ